jgi:hypothetical protein
VAGQGLVGFAVPTKVVALSGVSASGTVGTISMGTRLVAITGCVAMGQVGNVDKFYWTTIDDSETPIWQNVEMTV